MQTNLTIYTDGGCINNGNIAKSYGAFGYVILEGETILHEYSEFARNTTNQRMELMAISSSVGYLISNGVVDEKISIISDSIYCIKVLRGLWKAKANLDIILPFRAMLVENEIKINWKWVKGHNGNKWNDYVDNLCSIEIINYENNLVQS